MGASEAEAEVGEIVVDLEEVAAAEIVEVEVGFTSFKYRLRKIASGSSRTIRNGTNDRRWFRGPRGQRRATRRPWRTKRWW